MKRVIVKTCPKTGKQFTVEQPVRSMGILPMSRRAILALSSRAGRPCYVLLPITGLVALVWFLLRVIPKPSRATYPCQRVAAPLASAFVVWTIGLVWLRPSSGAGPGTCWTGPGTCWLRFARWPPSQSSGAPSARRRTIRPPRLSRPASRRTARWVWPRGFIPAGSSGSATRTPPVGTARPAIGGTTRIPTPRPSIRWYLRLSRG